MLMAALVILIPIRAVVNDHVNNMTTSIQQLRKVIEDRAWRIESQRR